MSVYKCNCMAIVRKWSAVICCLLIYLKVRRASFIPRYLFAQHLLLLINGYYGNGSCDWFLVSRIWTHLYHNELPARICYGSLSLMPNFATVFVGYTSLKPYNVDKGYRCSITRTRIIKECRIRFITATGYR